MMFTHITVPDAVLQRNLNMTRYSSACHGFQKNFKILIDDEIIMCSCCFLYTAKNIKTVTSRNGTRVCRGCKNRRITTSLRPCYVKRNRSPLNLSICNECIREIGKVMSATYLNVLLQCKTPAQKKQFYMAEKTANRRVYGGDHYLESSTVEEFEGDDDNYYEEDYYDEVNDDDY